MSVVFTSAAQTEMKEAAEWYRERSEDGPLRFRQQIDRTVQRIIANPAQFPSGIRKCRVAFVEVFPYLLHFKITDEQIIIVAVAHAKRKPQYFHRR